MINKITVMTAQIVDLVVFYRTRPFAHKSEDYILYFSKGSKIYEPKK